jgi:hypothetical protein
MHHIQIDIDKTILSQECLGFKSFADTLPTHLGSGDWKETAKEAHIDKFASAIERAKARRLKEEAKKAAC